MRTSRTATNATERLKNDEVAQTDVKTWCLMTCGKRLNVAEERLKLQGTKQMVSSYPVIAIFKESVN